MTAPRHHVTEIAVGGELVHVDVDMDHQRLRALAHRPMHGVALVEAGAEHEQAVELAAEDRAGGMAGAGVAEHAERQLMILREHALGAQGRRHRDRPALGQLLEARRGRVVLDAGAGQHGDADVAAVRIGEQSQRRFGLRQAQRLRAREEARDLAVVRRAFAGERVVRQREMHRTARLRPHGGERMAEPMIEVPAARHRLRQPRDRAHHGGVVERRLAGILEFAAPFHVDRHLAGQHQHRRAVGLGGGGRGRHVAAARAADPERRAEAAARARIAVRHVDGAALVRRHHRREPALPGQRRQERIDQAARNHEQVAEAFFRQRIEDVVGAELHWERHGCALFGLRGRDRGAAHRASARLMDCAGEARRRRHLACDRAAVAMAGAFWHRCALRPRPHTYGCGCSSGVEHDLAKVGVEGSNPFARSN